MTATTRPTRHPLACPVGASTAAYERFGAIVP